MGYSRDLFDLIHSLSPAEKRYFTLQSAGGTSRLGKNYLRLFEAVNRQKEFNEAEILDLFGENDFTKPLSSVKHYLFNAILQSMRAFHKGKKPASLVKDWIQDAEFLIQNGLPKMARKYVQKAKKQATKYELFTYLLEISILERKLLKSLQEKQLKEKLALVFREQQETLNKLHNLFDHYTRFDTLYQSALSDEGNEFAIPSLEATSFHSKRLSLTAEAIYYSLAKNYEASFQAFQKVKNNWEASPEMIQAHPANYKVSLANFMHACHITEQYAHFEPTLKAYASIPPRNKFERILDFQHRVQNDLLYRLNIGDLKGARTLVPRIADGLTKYAGELKPNLVLGITYNVATLFFLQKEFKLALRWADRIFHSKLPIIRKDIQRWGRAIRLIFLLEIGEEDRLESCLRSLTRDLRSKKDQPLFEHLLVRHISLLFNAVDGLADSSLCQLFLKEMEDWEKQSSGNRFPGTQEIKQWLNHRIKDQSSPL